jgi:hypothetical protein
MTKFFERLDLEKTYAELDDAMYDVQDKPEAVQELVKQQDEVMRQLLTISRENSRVKSDPVVYVCHICGQEYTTDQCLNCIG